MRQRRNAKVATSSLKKGAWSEAEFNRLKEAVAAYGNKSWVEIAACLPGRTNEQCRERWTEYLGAPGARTQWTEQDDKTLLQEVETMGKQWTAISVKIGNGTTGSQVRLLGFICYHYLLNTS
jgi:hypothetical protein